MIEIELEKIALLSEVRLQENDHFRAYLLQQDAQLVDEHVFKLNEAVSAAIDCTQCGNCCRSLMINVTPPELDLVAEHLDMSQDRLRAEYVEESAGGQLIINTIPCHFLAASKCSIYEQRFTECREFPHLHRPHFNKRLFGVFMYYGMCPIVFHVVEGLKLSTGFSTPAPIGPMNPG